MSGILSMKDALARKNGPCPVCGHMHAIQTQCAREALAQRISKLMEANSLIPGLLSQNKEVTELAENFRMMLVKVDDTHTILMQILSTYGNTGKEIEQKYMEALDAWAPKAKEPINQDTCDQQSLFSQEFLTPQEKKISDSTERVIGSSLDHAFGKQIKNATVAENNQK